MMIDDLETAGFNTKVTDEEKKKDEDFRQDFF